MLGATMHLKETLPRFISLSLLVLLSIPAFPQQPTGPKAQLPKASLPRPATPTGEPPATILLIRHAEKLADRQIDLSPAGFKRASMLPGLFASGRTDLPIPQAVIATRRSKRSN